ncbi:MAG: (2Fe-2S)-binding protein, partial [Pseudomonadota bacterium]
RMRRRMLTARVDNPRLRGKSCDGYLWQARAHVIAGLAELPARALLAGRPGADQPDPGAIVCACFNVGANTIGQAVAERGLMTVEAIGEATGAGTNCGSCRPELAAFLLPDMPKVAAE